MRRPPSPAEIEAGVERLVAQAVAQGLPEVISDPGVLSRLADIIRQAQSADEQDPSEPS